MSESPSREGSYLIVIMLLGGLCIGCAVWGVQQRTALRESENAAQLCQNDMAAYKRRVAAEKEAAKAKLASTRSIPAARRMASGLHHPYRSLFPPIPPGLMLGSPLIAPSGVGSTMRAPVPRGSVSHRPPGGFFGKSTERGVIHLSIRRGHQRLRGPSRQISPSMWKTAASWPVYFRQRVQRIHLRGISMSAKSVSLLRLFPSLRVLKARDVTLPDAGISSSELPLTIEQINLRRVSGNLTGLCARTLPGVRSLVLDAMTGVNDRGMRCLSRMPGLRVLKMIGLNGISDRGLAMLRSLSQLRTLRIDGNESIVGIGLLGIASSSRLERLQLDNMPKLEDDSLRHLASLTHLRVLSLQSSRLTGVGFRYLSRLQRVTTLDLRDSHLSDRGAAALSALHGITKLAADRVKITDAGALALGKLTRLQTLSLSEVRLTDAGVVGLSRLLRLRRLVLSHTKVGDRGVIFLQRLNALQQLFLYETRVTDRSLVAFANLRFLRRLDLGKTMVTEKGVQFLATHAKGLRWLRVSAMMLKETRRQLRREHPMLLIIDRQ